MAVCAKAQNKPFYVVAESFKFVRLFPLNQQDVPDEFKARTCMLMGVQAPNKPWLQRGQLLPMQT